MHRGKSLGCLEEEYGIWMWAYAEEPLLLPGIEWRFSAYAPKHEAISETGESLREFLQNQFHVK